MPIGLERVVAMQPAVGHPRKVNSEDDEFFADATTDSFECFEDLSETERLQQAAQILAALSAQIVTLQSLQSSTSSSISRTLIHASKMHSSLVYLNDGEEVRIPPGASSARSDQLKALQMELSRVNSSSQTIHVESDRMANVTKTFEALFGNLVLNTQALHSNFRKLKIHPRVGRSKWIVVFLFLMWPPLIAAIWRRFRLVLALVPAPFFFTVSR